MDDTPCDAKHDYYALWSDVLGRRTRALLARSPDLDADDREDLLGEAREYLVAILDAHQADIKNLEAYAWTSVRHFVLRRVEQTRRYREIMRPLEGTEPAESGDPEAMAEIAVPGLLHAAIRRLANSLPQQDQALLQSCLVDGVPVAELARMLGLPRTTVTSRLTKAVRALRTALLEEAERDPRLAQEIVELWGGKSLTRLLSDRLRSDGSSPKRRRVVPKDAL